MLTRSHAARFLTAFLPKFLFRRDGVRHVRDGGPGVPEEREARHPHHARGGQTRGQARHAGAHARPVRAGDRQRNCKVRMAHSYCTLFGLGWVSHIIL